MSDRPDDLEALAARLEASGAYKVLRRLRRTPRIDRASLPEGAREAVVIDLETTGLDAAVDVPIEIGLVRFAYDPDGRILGVTGELSALEDPGRPLPPEVAALTGLSDADLAGQRFPDARVTELLDGVGLVVAHNAGFDRPFAEKRWPELQRFPWACSWRDVPWQDGEGFASGKLEQLLLAHGVFFDGHRAVEDVYATLDLLGRALPSDGELAFNRLRANARATTVRLWAVKSPFDAKDLLKARGYRWNGEARTWWTEVAQDALAAELAFLDASVYPRGAPKLPTVRIDAWSRYATRVPDAPPR
ncbi:MAG: 3'-5' exonuclease [Trueperaceae bacterium]|nr:3'-5' exonuclease [Trueperaceae bacterium]